MFKLFISLGVFGIFTCWHLGILSERPTGSSSIISYKDKSMDTLRPPAGIRADDENWLHADLGVKPAVLANSIKEEKASFILPEGFEIECVLADPSIKEPAAIQFDGQGRMYVLELRTYMQTADSKGELEASSRISRWEDRDADGYYESGGVFIDSLVFPRFVCPIGHDAVLCMETDADYIFKYSDTDSDGKADKKELFASKYGRSGNVEHQQALLTRGMDNWLYSTVNAFRIRENAGEIIRENTGYNRAQWGLCQDNDGKLWFQGGASGLPSHFQFPIIYGNFEVKNEIDSLMEVPHGAAIGLADVQGGMDQVNPDGSLNRVTGSSGNDIYRGHRMPAFLQGKYFYAEPVARILRMIDIKKKNGLSYLSNAYESQKTEFLKSTDPLFRPVEVSTAPDGSLYVVDMYRGIIQEGQWTQKGSYLRTKIEQYQLDKVVGHGRIWRISHKNHKRDKIKPDFQNYPPSKLLEMLSHPNGWWRDAAQHEILFRKPKNQKINLESIAKSSTSDLARIHALWTLEGLEQLDSEFLKDLYLKANQRLKQHILRVAESLIKKGDESLYKLFEYAGSSASAELELQTVLSLNLLKPFDYINTIKIFQQKSKFEEVKSICSQIINGSTQKKNNNLSDKTKAQLARGSQIYQETCSSCHGNTGLGTPAGKNKWIAPALANNPRMQNHYEYAVRVILNGLNGEIEKKSYQGVQMLAMAEQSDQWIADVVSYIRMELSNDAPAVTEHQVAKIREKHGQRTASYHFDSLMIEIPKPLFYSSTWKIRASDMASTRIGGKADASSAFNFEGWTTGIQQKKGQWFEIEFNENKKISELHFISNRSPKKEWETMVNRPKGPAPTISNAPENLILESFDPTKGWISLLEQKGEDGYNELKFKPILTNKIRLKIAKDAENKESSWSIKQAVLYQ
jgi:mono/diheme cytochrome c family protein